MKVSVDIEKYAEQEIEGLANFYKDLGWDPNIQTLDPKKVNVSQNDWDKLFVTLFGDKTFDYGLWYVNYGPRLSRKVRNGHVVLDKGWVSNE